MSSGLHLVLIAWYIIFKLLLIMHGLSSAEQNLESKEQRISTLQAHCHSV